MADSKPTPTRDSVLTLREINKDNWRAIANLEPSDAQAGNLAPNIWSLCLSHYAEDAWIRGIYADDETPVGLLMMAIWDPTELYFLWRFMIDERYQGLGFGKRSVQLAIDHIRTTRPHAKRFTTMSTPKEGHKSENPKLNVEAEHSPFKFYESLGFRQTEPPNEDDEVVLTLDLQ